MKKINFLIALGLLATASMQAQTTIASLGFEDGDKSYVTKTAYTPGTYGNLINQLAGDEWNEQYTGDKHSGSKAFYMNNSVENNGNTWERGFVVGNLNLKDKTSYRVSFWVKAEQTYLDADGNEKNTALKSSLFIGHEYCDMPICAKDGFSQYYYNYTNGVMDGEWKRFSYVTFFPTKADLDAVSTNYTGKADPDGNVPVAQGDPFPEEYGLIINMYSPGEYLLDDIKVEEGVAFNAATFLDDVIKLDFGYETNIADLAKANNGTVSLDPSCVTVTIDGKAAPVAYVEGKEDGFLYIFLQDISADENANVLVSFTPAADCPILYTSVKRPSYDTDSEMQVLGFKDEVAYYDMSVDALPSIFGPGVLMSSVPENESFELEPFEKAAFTFDKAMSIDNAIAYYTKNGIVKELPIEAITQSEDGKTVYVAVGKLGDGEYDLVLSGMANSLGIECDGDQVINFSIGKDTDDTKSEVVYATDFDNQMTGGVPQGWLTKSEDYPYEGATELVDQIHEYGFNADGSQFNYNWGGQPGGGGARLYEGFSGDFNKAFYWCSRQSGVGYASFGELVSDYLTATGDLDMDALAAKFLKPNDDGTYNEDDLANLPSQIALKLEPRKYQISFTMAAWKGEPTFNFTLEDLHGGVYAKFEGYKAAPNVGGATTRVTGATKCVTDFTVDKPGYYMLKFSNATEGAHWQEFLLANVKLITMPSKAAYYRQLLEEAVEKVEEVAEQAESPEYDGETKTAFMKAYNSAKNDHFTSGAQVTAVIEQLETQGAKLTTRINNIDDFAIAVLEAGAGIEELEGKYQEADIAKKAQAIIAKYEDVNPSTLSDEELAKASADLKTAAAQVVNTKDYVDIVTWGAYKASQTAELFGLTEDVEAARSLVKDDRTVVDAVNAASTAALYDKIVAKADLSEYMEKVYDTQNQNPDSEADDPNYNEEGYPLFLTGINFTGLIANPHLYTFVTDGASAFAADAIPGWTVEQLDYDIVDINSEEGNHLTGKGSVHSNGNAAATEAMPVADITLNAYSNGCEYKFFQTIENAPVGVYEFYMGTRTGKKNEADAEGEYGAFNAQAEDGTWDKYLFAQVDDEKPIMVPFVSSSTASPQATKVTNITVKEGQKLTIGVVEHLVSGKASAHTWDAELGAYKPTNFWDSNTYADDARLFFVKALDGYDYAKAAEEIHTGIDAVATAGAAKKSTAIYNLAGQRVNDTYKGIVIKNGKKVYVK